jgi:hypothetical protein
MGVFREGGSGQSRLIAAIQALFTARNQRHELIITVITGTAAFNIKDVNFIVSETSRLESDSKDLGKRRQKNGLNVII